MILPDTTCTCTAPCRSPWDRNPLCRSTQKFPDSSTRQRMCAHICLLPCGVCLCEPNVCRCARHCIDDSRRGLCVWNRAHVSVSPTPYRRRLSECSGTCIPFSCRAPDLSEPACSKGPKEAIYVPLGMSRVANKPHSPWMRALRLISTQSICSLLAHSGIRHWSEHGTCMLTVVW